MFRDRDTATACHSRYCCWNDPHEASNDYSAGLFTTSMEDSVQHDLKAQEAILSKLCWKALRSCDEADMQHCDLLKVDIN